MLSSKLFANLRRHPFTFWFGCFYFFLISPLFAQIATDSLPEFSRSHSASESALLGSSPSINAYSAGVIQPYLMYDPLNGFTFGAPNIHGYAAGFLREAAVFGGAQNYLRYNVGGQIPFSGAIQFFIHTPGFQTAYQGNFIFTQPGYGSAARGDVILMLWPDNRLWFGQWSGSSGWWNSLVSAPLPLNQWVKITVVYGIFGMYLYVNDQLMATDLSRRIPLSSRPFYFGTTSFWGREVAFSGKLDEIITYANPPVKIMSPESGTIFMPDDKISFLGFGLNLTWSCQGISIGSGNLVKTTLPPGEHTITVSGQNAIGGSGEDSITVVVQSAIEVSSIIANPSSMWLDDNGNGSGIVFRATTSEIGSVDFKVQTPSGSIIPIGSKSTIQQGSEYVAKLSWWGQPGLEEGIYTIIAEAGSSSKSSTFEVKHSAVSLTGLGKWMKKSKDPSAVLPPFAAAEVCPLNPWEEMLSLPNGYFSAISVSDPVNVSSGNFVLSQVDLNLKSRYNLTLARIYNSLDPRITAFGRGWSSPFLVNLEIGTDQVVFTNSDGTRLLFSRSGCAFSPVTATDLELTLNSDTGFYTLIHPHGSNWVFDSQGRILQMSKACCGQGANDAIVFSYDGSGKLSSVTAPSGKSLTFSYNAAGLIASIADSTGRSLGYTYDENSNLISFTDALNRITTYSYDESDFMTSYTKPGNLTSEITYSEHRVASIKDPTGAQSTFSWDFTSPKLTLTDFAGTVHEYAFDAEWRINSYSVPSADLSKEFSTDNGRVAAISNSLGYSDLYRYDENGFYKYHTDKLGNVTTFTWHPTLKKLTGKTDALGRTWSYEWCSRGNLVKQTDPAGHETTYTYDSHNNRTSKTDAIGHITRYIYDTTGNYLVQTIDAIGGVSSFTYDTRGNLTSSSDQLGRTTSYEYDLIDRLIKSTYPDGRFTQISYDDAGNIASRIDNMGRITAYTYDANGKLLTTTRPDGTVLSHAYDAAGRKIISTDALGRVTAYEYDALDNMVRVTYPDQSYLTYVYNTEKRLVSNTDELGNQTAYEYDPLGRILATIDPAGARYENTYDAAGRKVAAKNPLGRITAYEYDVLDRVVKTVAPDATFNTSSYDAVGNLLVSTNALNQQTVYEYDALNRQVKTIQPNGAQFITSYDEAGQVISVIDALGNSTVNAYDNAGRRISTTNALNHVWQYVYDAAGRLIRTIDPMNGVATMTYDVMDRVVTESDALGRVTAYEYDASGKRIAKTDALGRRNLYGYDTRDRLTAEVDAEGRMVSHGYDAAGRKISLTDGAGRIWRWIYDSLGRVTAEIDPLGNEVKSSYDAVGNLTLKTNARAQATGYEYDLMNRLVKVNYPDSTAATFSYDALGRELTRSGLAGTVTKSYDTAGNLLFETFVNHNKGWSYSYDIMGNRIQAISPENETYSYAYDALNRLLNTESSITGSVTRYYDSLSRIVEEKRPGSLTRNNYDAAGQLLETSHRTLNHAGQPDRLIASRHYSYDSAGNRIGMTDEDGRVTSYAYDNSSWLTQVTYSNGDVVSYTYNGAGDRTSEQHGNEAVLNYVYDAAGRMTAKGSDLFSYDADGNLIHAVEGDVPASYTWNSDNRLIEVARAHSGCKHDKERNGYGYGHPKHGDNFIEYERYAYLPQDWRRLSRIAGYIRTQSKTPIETAEHYVSIYNGSDESHEYLVVTGQNATKLQLSQVYVSGPETDDLTHTRTAEHSLAMLKDGLGSTIALVGNDGACIAKIAYDAWGQFFWPAEADKDSFDRSKDDWQSYLGRLEKTRGFGTHNSWSFGKQFATQLTPYLYTGRRYAELTGQYFNRHRYYSPALGRFTSKDPIGFNGGMNLYRYADNNPIIYTDPTGNIAWAPALLNPANWVLLAAFIEGLRAIHNTDVKCDTSGDDDYDFDDANRPCKESEMTPVLILIVPPGAAGHFEYGHASLLSTAGVRGWWPTPEATINNLFGLGRVRDDTMTATRFSEPGRGYRACPESQKKIVEMIGLSLAPKNWLFDLHNTKGRNCAGWVGQVLQGAGFSPPMPPATPDLSPLLLK